MEKIEIGDTVYLKSGSPKMTVFAIAKGRASVVWNHYATGIIREQKVSLKALVKTIGSVSPTRRSYNRSRGRGPELNYEHPGFEGFEDHEFQN